MIEAEKKDLLLSIVLNYVDTQKRKEQLPQPRPRPASWSPPLRLIPRRRNAYNIPLDTLHEESKLEWSLFRVALGEIVKDGFLRDDVMADVRSSSTTRQLPGDTHPPETKITVVEVQGVASTYTGEVFFVYQGGYKAQEKRLNAERQTQVSDRLWNRSNILIALFAFLVSYCSYRGSESNKQSSTDQQTTIDSLKKQIDLLRADIRKMAPYGKTKRQ